MEIPLASAEVEDDEEHCRNVHVEQELEEENRSNFKKLHLKTLANSARNTVKKERKGEGKERNPFDSGIKGYCVMS
jgi:hypothetical protein